MGGSTIVSVFTGSSAAYDRTGAASSIMSRRCVVNDDVRKPVDDSGLG